MVCYNQNQAPADDGGSSKSDNALNGGPGGRRNPAVPEGLKIHDESGDLTGPSESESGDASPGGPGRHEDPSAVDLEVLGTHSEPGNSTGPSEPRSSENLNTHADASRRNVSKPASADHNSKGAKIIICCAVIIVFQILITATFVFLD